MNNDIIFVTIGVPFSSIPIMQKVMLFVDLEKQTAVQTAKKLRKNVADNIENYGWVAGTRFTPAELYYDIYISVDEKIPLTSSVNSPYIKKMEKTIASEGADKFWREFNNG